MKNTLQRATVVLAALALVVVLAPTTILAQDYHGGSLNARQHGYEHGYEDGYAAGRGSSLSNRDQDIRNQQLKAQGNGYQPNFGSETEYSEGYKEGFNDDNADSRNGTQSRLEQLFRSPDPGFNADRHRNDSSDAIYRQNHWPDDHIARDIGYKDGVNAGLQDRRARRSYMAHQHQAWKDGLHGYAGTPQISKAAYRMAYRIAYEDGYRAGYGTPR